MAVYFLNLPALPSYALLYDQLKSKAHQESPARDSSPCPDGTLQSSSLLCYFKSADEHNGKPSNVLFGRGLDNSIQMHTEQRPMGGVWKYCIPSNVPWAGFGNIAYRATPHGRGLEIYHFNALGRGFGEYIVTLVKLRKGCMQQACSAPDTTFVSLPAGGRNLQPSCRPRYCRRIG